MQFVKTVLVYCAILLCRRAKSHPVVYGSYIPYNVLYENSSPQNLVALTFDDGPFGAEMLESMLTTLRSLNVTATFFFETRKMIEFAASVREAMRQGHVLASHSADHVALTRLNDTELLDDMSRANADFRDVVGLRSFMIREPYGESDDRVQAWLTEGQYVVVRWNKNTRDWNCTSDECVLERCRTEFPMGKPGGILLMHMRSRTASMLSECLQQIRSQGFTFVSLFAFMRQDIRRHLFDAYGCTSATWNEHPWGSWCVELDRWGPELDAPLLEGGSFVTSRHFASSFVAIASVALLFFVLFAYCAAASWMYAAGIWMKRIARLARITLIGTSLLAIAAVVFIVWIRGD